MNISLVVAMDRNGVIGIDGKLPWRLPAELQNFKAITMGKPLVMGRRTHESIGRVLPGRENIVLTRDRDYRAEGCTVLHGAEEVLAHCAGAPEIMVIGGSEVFRAFLPRAGRIYLTEVHTAAVGDTHFPELDRSQWKESERRDFAADARNEYGWSYVVLDRIN